MTWTMSRRSILRCHVRCNLSHPKWITHIGSTCLRNLSLKCELTTWKKPYKLQLVRRGWSHSFLHAPALVTDYKSLIEAIHAHVWQHVLHALTCSCVYVSVPIHACILICVCVFVRDMHVYLNIFTYIYVYVCSYIWLYMKMNVYVRMCIYE